MPRLDARADALEIADPGGGRTHLRPASRGSRVPSSGSGMPRPEVAPAGPAAGPESPLEAPSSRNPCVRGRASGRDAGGRTSPGMRLALGGYGEGDPSGPVPRPVLASLAVLVVQAGSLRSTSGLTVASSALPLSLALTVSNHARSFDIRERSASPEVLRILRAMCPQ